MRYHVVAFIDVLGFSEMVARDAASPVAIHLPKFITIIKEIRSEYGEEVRMFSDSIIVNAELNLENAHKVVLTAKRLQQKFLGEEIVVRGGVSYGKHFSDAEVIYSEALVNAYRLESKAARNPRVLVDKNVVDYFVNHPSCTPEMRRSFCDLLQLDKDGLSFIDYFDTENLESLAPLLRKLAAEAVGNGDAVMEKMRWLVDYFNYAVRRAGLGGLVIGDLGWEFSPLQ